MLDIFGIVGKVRKNKIVPDDPYKIIASSDKVMLPGILRSAKPYEGYLISESKCSFSGVTGSKNPEGSA